MFHQTKSFKLIVLVFFVFLIILSGIWLQEMLTFRYLGSNPEKNNIATASPFIKLKFSKKLSRDVSVDVVPSFAVVDKKIEGSEIVILLNSPLDSRINYGVHLSKISSESGQHINDISFSFSPSFIADEKLPKDQKEAINNIQQGYNKRILGDKLVQLLPFSSGGNEFQVSYSVKYEKQKPILTIEISSYTNDGLEKAYKWMHDVGVDPSAYTIKTSLEADGE